MSAPGLSAYPRVEMFYCEICEAALLAVVEIKTGATMLDGVFARLPLSEAVTIMQGCEHLSDGLTLTDRPQ